MILEAGHKVVGATCGLSLPERAVQDVPGKCQEPSEGILWQNPDRLTKAVAEELPTERELSKARCREGWEGSDLSPSA